MNRRLFLRQSGTFGASLLTATPLALLSGCATNPPASTSTASSPGWPPIPSWPAPPPPAAFTGPPPRPTRCTTAASPASPPPACAKSASDLQNMKRPKRHRKTAPKVRLSPSPGRRPGLRFGSSLQPCKGDSIPCLNRNDSGDAGWRMDGERGRPRLLALAPSPKSSWSASPYGAPSFADAPSNSAR